MSLPIDILGLIFNHLTQQDLKKVRPIDRTLHKFVNFRITHVFLSPNRTNLDAFRDIAASETFCNNVCEVIWDDAKLAAFLCREGKCPYRRSTTGG
jgi:hypothetical protein